MNDIKREISYFTEEIYEEIIKIRHALHEHPELSYEEFETAELVERTLSKWRIPSRRLAGSTAVLAEIKGELHSEKCIGLRADMDALPIEEEASVPYRSKRRGVMHACGHDIHTANLLGTAYVLTKMKPFFGGTVKLVFQPAEEVGGGAKEILSSGVIENPPVQAFLAAHVLETIPVGQIQIKDQEVMMAASSFTITLSGRGGHASAPHETEDIILASARVILDLQLIAGKKINHIEPALITVGSIHGGTRGNIIPEKVVLQGTIRTQKDSLRLVIHEEIRKVLAAQKLVSGVEAEVDFRLGSGAVYNDIPLTQLFIKASELMIGEENVLRAKLPEIGSENFYQFSRTVPSVFFRLGVHDARLGPGAAAHSPRFTATDASLKTGISVMTAAVLTFLAEKGACDG
ncbi:MAG: amidohydrolase [Sporomusaceae bacterium]|nr:amidohydrolase [Sporomusaceae bacterium]